MNARGRDDSKTPLNGTAHEYVAGKKRQGNLFFSIRPLPDRGVGGKENLYSVPGQTLGDRLFVLMAGVDRMPLVPSLDGDFLIYYRHCELIHLD
jgi:hypothetical protein